MIYNCISDTCSIIFQPKLAVKWSVCDKEHYSIFIKMILRVGSSMNTSIILAAWRRGVMENCVVITADML